MSALELCGLRVPFGEAPGLDGISLEVPRGERLAILGPSGVGKTTLLRAVAGLAPVSAGSVRINGRDVTAAPPESRGAVYLHQTPTLFPHLDVFENVAFPLRIRGAAERELRARVSDVLASVGLAELGPRTPATLSGGQRHRVALARAIAARPAVLLLDEPLAALDPSLRQEVREAIVAVQERDRPALVLVTHDVDEAGVLAHRLGVLVGGVIAQIDTPGTLFDRPISLEVARLLGFPNRLDGVLREDGTFDSALGPVRLARGGTRPGPAAAVFQPEAAHEDPAGAPGRVVSLRHRPRAGSAIVAIGETTIEIADPRRSLAAGDEVRIALDPHRLVVYPRAG